MGLRVDYATPWLRGVFAAENSPDRRSNGVLDPRGSGSVILALELLSFSPNSHTGFQASVLQSKQ